MLPYDLKPLLGRLEKLARPVDLALVALALLDRLPAPRRALLVARVVAAVVLAVGVPVAVRPRLVGVLRARHAKVRVHKELLPRVRGLRVGGVQLPQLPPKNPLPKPLARPLSARVARGADLLALLCRVLGRVVAPLVAALLITGRLPAPAVVAARVALRVPPVVVVVRPLRRNLLLNVRPL